jgi:glutamate racemase
MSRQPIGVFDSGIGGLTVLKELLAHLPGESFIYFGDTARVPYGNKSPETVRRFSREVVGFLLERGVKMVVIACNTASAEALPRLGSEFPVPIIGVIEPGARAAAMATRGGSIGVIGTLGTIRSGAYEKAIKAVMPGASVHPVACPLFVPLVEEGWVEHAVTREVVREYLADFIPDEEGHSWIDTLVLGCTHYPLLKPVIGDTLRSGVVLVDSAIETAREVSRILGERTIEGSGGNGEFHIVLSDTSPTFGDIAARFLGRRVPEIELVSVP